MLPSAARGQHGKHRARHQLGAAAVEARRRRRADAHQHPRARRADQGDREPVLGRHPGDEAARGQLLLRQPAWRAAGRRRGLSQRPPPRHPALSRHQARECGREDPHQDAVARRGDPGRDLRARQARRGHVPLLAARRGKGLWLRLLGDLGDREIRRDGGRPAHPQDARSTRAPSSRRWRRSSSRAAIPTSCSRTR